MTLRLPPTGTTARRLSTGRSRCNLIPKVAGKGASFKGAGAYYLHDQEAETRERVAFTHTENLPTNDPDLAIRHPAYTAMHQDQIKAPAGVKATGRKSAQSVYTYSLSWAPDETPTKEEMIEAGRETLKALGLEGHEALMVAHNDEPHPHLHVIVCRVNPKTGIMAPLNKDFLKLSRWAEEYERRQGQIRCDQRVENNEKRRKGQFVKYRDGDAATIHHWRKMRRERAFKVRRAEAANLSATQRGERQALQDEQRSMRKALYEEKEQRIAMVRKYMRERNRPEWAALFRRQREERKELNAWQKSAYLRLRYLLKHRGHDPQAAAKTGMKEMTGGGAAGRLRKGQSARGSVTEAPGRPKRTRAGNPAADPGRHAPHQQSIPEGNRLSRPGTRAAQNAAARADTRAGRTA